MRKLGIFLVIWPIALGLWINPFFTVGVMAFVGAVSSIYIGLDLIFDN